MFFNVAGLLRESVGAVRRFTLEKDPPVHRGWVELLRMPEGVLVRCQAAVVIDAACSRCLAPFGYPEEIDFEEVFYQQVDLATGLRLEAPNEPEAFLIARNHTIDITEAVRQYTETAAAMQPLCRPDCPGLCAVCGQDLSMAICACARVPVDSRWAALAALKLSAEGVSR